MPMELRKRKAPANPPPPAPVKKAKSAEPAKKKGPAAKAKAAVATVKKAVEEKVEEITKPAAEKPVAAENASGATAPATAAAAPLATAPAPAATSAKKGKAKAPAATKKDTDAKPAVEKPADTKLKVGDALPADLPEIVLDDGKTTTFSALLEASDKGIVMFSYTKAATGGCTSQACAMRDNYSLFTGAGWSVYGLSADSVTANSNWKTKQKLNYPLISDTTLNLHEKLGIKKNGKGSRNVIVIQKEGRIVKELKTVAPAVSLEVAKAAAGISGTTVTKKDVVTTAAPADEKADAKTAEAAT